MLRQKVLMTGLAVIAVVAGVMPAQETEIRCLSGKGKDEDDPVSARKPGDLLKFGRKRGDPALFRDW